MKIQNQEERGDRYTDRERNSSEFTSFPYIILVLVIGGVVKSIFLKNTALFLIVFLHNVLYMIRILRFRPH